MKKILVLALALIPLSAGADILMLRDGTQYVGKFVSGSDNSVMFQPDNGTRRSFHLSEVQSIQFDAVRSGILSHRTDVQNSGTTMNAARTIPAGTSVVVRTNESIDSTQADTGRSYTAAVDQDVTDNAGTILIPHGSEAELVVRDMNKGGTTGSPELVLDLQSIRMGGQRYLVSTADVTKSNAEGLGRISAPPRW